MNDLVALPRSPALAPETRAPALIAASGERAERRFWEFFTVTIRNPNTRRAYRRAAAEFCAFLADGGVTRLEDIQPMHVAAYVELLGRSHSPSTVKLRLAAIRILCDWLVVG